LGGITVLLKLPPAVSIFHACLAQIFFCLTVTIAFVTSPKWEKSLRNVGKSLSIAIPILCGFLSVAFFMQLLFGASMRHFGAGLAIPDFPLAFGQVVPPLVSSEIVIHFMHRMGALFLSLYVVGLCLFIFNRYSFRLDLIGLSGLLVGLVSVQAVLGAMSVVLSLPVGSGRFCVRIIFLSKSISRY